MSEFTTVIATVGAGFVIYDNGPLSDVGFPVNSQEDCY